jgi:hypothetical protein
MKGYKVVNYKEWSCLPEIFTSVYLAKEALFNWKYKKGAVVESFNQRYGNSRVIFYNKANKVKK